MTSLRRNSTSPLARGLLTGEYLDGILTGSRASVPGFEWTREGLTLDLLPLVTSEVAERLDALSPPQ